MSDTPGYMILFPPDAERADVETFRALWSRMKLEIVAMNPDPLRPIDTDAPVDDPGRLTTSSPRRVALPPGDPTLLGNRPAFPTSAFVIALGVIVGILIAWAVR